MKKLKIRMLTAIMTLFVMCSFVISVSASGEDDIPNYDHLVQPCLDNCSDAAFSFSTFDGGAHIYVSYTGYTDKFSYAKLTVELEKKVLGLFWTTVDIGENTAEWEGRCFELLGEFSETFSISGSGTYRATMTLEVYGIDGSVDVLSDVITSSYDG